MGNYRSRLKKLGCPELEVSTQSKKRGHEKAPAKNVKKPRKAEVNVYLLTHKDKQKKVWSMREWISFVK